MKQIRNILAIDTSCDETSASVVEKTRILSNVIWSQASLHANFGGVYPTLAKRKHQERIDWVINKALKKSGLIPSQIDAVAVTVGPGLAPALEVGITKAKEFSNLYNIPIYPINHLEGHLFSFLAKSKNDMNTTDHSNLFPAYGLIISGGNSQFLNIEKIGKYKIIAKTSDDALGEALDKAARLLGLGYPGGPILEKFAKKGNDNIYKLPIPMVGNEHKGYYSYSGLKTAFVRLIDKIGPKNLNPQLVFDLALLFQKTAFIHLIKVTEKTIVLTNNNNKIKNIIIGGGVAANNQIRKMLRTMAKAQNLNIHFPYSKRLCGDNAAMIGVAAYLKYQSSGKSFNKNAYLDRIPKYSLEEI